MCWLCSNKTLQVSGLLPRWCGGKESICWCRGHKKHRFDPWVGKIPWSRKWQFNPVFLPGKFHGQRSLVSLQCTHTHILFLCVQRVRHNWAHIHTHSQQDIVGWPLEKLCDWEKLGTTVQSRWWVHGYSLHDFIQLFQMLENFWKKQKYYISLPLRKQIMFILSRIDAIIKLSPEGGVYK